MSFVRPAPVHDAQIIELDAHRQAEEPKLRALRGVPCFCNFVVDAHRRTVSCSRCKRVWDPFAALLFLSRAWDRYSANRDSLKREVEAKRELLAQLRKDLRNLKAQRKRATTRE